MVIQVNVIQRADSIQVSQRTLSMIAGRTATLTAIISPAATANQNVTWVSGDDSIVSVDENGKLTAHKAGTVDISKRNHRVRFIVTVILRIRYNTCIS